MVSLKHLDTNDIKFVVKLGFESTPKDKNDLFIASIQFKLSLILILRNDGQKWGFSNWK